MKGKQNSFGQQKIIMNSKLTFTINTLYFDIKKLIENLSSDFSSKLKNLLSDDFFYNNLLAHEKVIIFLVVFTIIAAFFLIDFLLFKFK
jgi:hypothetical protein